MGGMMPPGPGMPPMMPGVPPGNSLPSLPEISLCNLCCGEESLHTESAVLSSGLPPPVGHRPGIAHMAQVSPAANMLSRPAVPAATAPSAQPDVSKPLFPIAGQVKSFSHPF